MTVGDLIEELGKYSAHALVTIPDFSGCNVICQDCGARLFSRDGEYSPATVKHIENGTLYGKVVIE